MTDPATLIATEPYAPYLAVDVLPDNVPGTFLVDESEVDSPDLLGWGMDGWLNVVCDVLDVDLARGATRLQGPLTRTEAGAVRVQLEDIDRRFDPIANADAVHPGTRVRLRAWAGEESGLDPWSAVLFTGRIGARSLTVDYRLTGPPLVAFTVVDVVAPLSRFRSLGRPDPGVGAGDTLRGRVGRVLTETGSTAVVATDSDSAYFATLPASTLATGWDGLVAATEAELGRLWVNAADQLVVRSRGSQLSGPVRGTLSDVHGETVAGTPHCCYSDPVVRFGTEMLTNRVVGARRVPRPADGTTPAAPALVQADDTYSQARWSEGMPASYEDRSLELSSDAEVRPWAEWLLLSTSAPELRVDQVTVAPGDSPEAWRAVCLTDIGDRWHFRLHPEVGPAVEQTLGVLGIRHSISPDGWTVTLLTMRAPTPGVENPSGWVTVDVSTLGSDDVLPPFGGTVLA